MHPWTSRREEQEKGAGEAKISGARLEVDESSVRTM